MRYVLLLYESTTVMHITYMSSASPISVENLQAVANVGSNQARIIRRVIRRMKNKKWSVCAGDVFRCSVLFSCNPKSVGLLCWGILWCVNFINWFYGGSAARLPPVLMVDLSQGGAVSWHNVFEKSTLEEWPFARSLFSIFTLCIRTQWTQIMRFFKLHSRNTRRINFVIYGNESVFQRYRNRKCSDYFSRNANDIVM